MTQRTQLIPPDVYRYVLRSSREPEALAHLRKATANVPHAVMQIGADQGELLALLVKLIGARRCIEIGTYTGYSALAVALALPADGLLIACDVNEEWTSQGQPFWREAGVDSRIDLRIKPAIETLDELLAEGGRETFDFAFVDADKENAEAYYEHAFGLLRAGGLFAFDNALWGGSVADPSDQRDSTRAVRALTARVCSDQRVSATLIPVGDGLLVARKR